MRLGLRKLPVDLAEIADLMSTSFDENHVYLDTHTGDVVALPDELIGPLLDDPDEPPDLHLPAWEAELIPLARAVANDEADRFVELPEPDGREDYDIMRKFAEGVESPAARERLLDALRGPHPSRNLRRALDNCSELVKPWHAYRDAEHERLAREWLAELGIEPVEP